MERSFQMQFMLIYAPIPKFMILQVIFFKKEIFNVKLILAESPADNFLYMRDYSDCLSCSTLPEFSKNFLMLGFNKNMKNAAREKFKLHNVFFGFIF